MRVQQYNQYLRMSRRSLLKGTAAAAVVGMTGRFSPSFAQAFSPEEADLRSQIAAIPGVGARQPTDADWQKVGELCLGPTKEFVQPGEFKGVELSFMGLNTQGLHIVLFRGLLKAWEDYTGAKINYIELANDEFNARLQRSIALGTVDFDLIEMGPPFEGDTAGRGLLSEMPDWVPKSIDMDDYVDYLKAPIGTWDGKTYRISVDGDCHIFNYRTDVFADEALAENWAGVADKAGLETWGVPSTWQQVQAATRFLKGKQVDGEDAFGYLDHCKPWGGFGFYFLMDRAAPYAKYPGDPAWIFEAGTMKPRINDPAWVRAIQDVLDALPYEPSDQLNMDGMGTGFTQFMAGTGSMLAWWGDIGQNANTSDQSVVGDRIAFSVNPASEEVYNTKTGAWEKLASGPNAAPNMAFGGLGIYVTKNADADERKRKAAWAAAAHLGGKNLALWLSMYPSGMQPYRNSQFIAAEYVAAGYDEGYITSYLNATRDTYNHANPALDLRIPGTFQYYSVGEDILAKIYAGDLTAQKGADEIAAAWDKITDQLGRDSQIKLYGHSLGQKG
jgi:multiple sugar transport system substrate-binding protein